MKPSKWVNSVVVPHGRHSCFTMIIPFHLFIQRLIYFTPCTHTGATGKRTTVQERSAYGGKNHRPRCRTSVADYHPPLDITNFPIGFKPNQHFPVRFCFQQTCSWETWNRCSKSRIQTGWIRFALHGSAHSSLQGVVHHREPFEHVPSRDRKNRVNCAVHPELLSRTNPRLASEIRYTKHDSKCKCKCV